MQYERKYTWSILLRLYHWALALSVLALSVTGFYIHFPWTNTMLEGGSSFPVATMRYIHFIAAFVFTGAVLARLYLLIFGNRQERFWDFLPITPRNIKNLVATLGVYSYLRDSHDERLGHNALAGSAYGLTFLAAAVQALTGFYMLYPESATWQQIVLFFGPQQTARFIHYLLTWYFMLFALIHIYLCVWNDVMARDGLISSIFSGYKFRQSKS
ncbi:Ni/Fe-hydrogenase, b-type cytochrome subunit [Desulfolithobacter sp.]